MKPSVRSRWTVPWLALQSLRNRRTTSLISICTIATSVALLIGATSIQRSARASFSGVISQTDLIVGPKGGATQLLLYAIFHLGSPISNIDYADYRRVAEHPSVAWTIPISLGDSHRGYRVVATSPDYFRHYRFHDDERIELAEGQFLSGLWDVVLGAEVARALGYGLGDELVLTHGATGTGILDHEDKPFRLTGVLEATGTPIDRSVFVTLEGYEAMHIDWQSGAPPLPGQGTPAESIRAEDIQVDEITAFLLGTRSRIESLGLQREINTDEDLDLMAILPGVTLSELWQVVDYSEKALLLVAGLVAVTGLLGMAMTIYASLEARRRELAILRALGSGAREIAGLLTLEAAFLSTAGALLGIALYYGALVLLQPIIRSELGLLLPIQPLTGLEWGLVGAVILTGTLMAIPPALRAYRSALADGLAVRL